MFICNLIETEEPSSSLIDLQQFEPEKMNVEPNLISSSYHQKGEDDDDFKMHVEQKGKINVF